MSLTVRRMLAHQPAGHEPIEENPVVIGEDTLGPPGVGAPNLQKWQRPSRPIEPGLEQGDGVAPVRMWQHHNYPMKGNPRAWARNLGTRLWSLATVDDPQKFLRPHYKGFMGTNFIQEVEPRPKLSGIKVVSMPNTPSIPWGAGRVVGGGGGERT